MNSASQSLNDDTSLLFIVRDVILLFFGDSLFVPLIWRIVSMKGNSPCPLWKVAQEIQNRFLAVCPEIEFWLRAWHTSCISVVVSSIDSRKLTPCRILSSILASVNLMVIDCLRRYGLWSSRKQHVHSGWLAGHRTTNYWGLPENPLNYSVEVKKIPGHCSGWHQHSVRR